MKNLYAIVGAPRRGRSLKIPDRQVNIIFVAEDDAFDFVNSRDFSVSVLISINCFFIESSAWKQVFESFITLMVLLTK